MYLKSIEIQGFKSFAKKTTLEFLPTNAGRFSITVIVGPNGSGKSNIADAVQWVMGEQSMKTLRSKKGEDIIFSGSELKGKLSVASVSLFLDNSDKKAPIEFDELIISRKLYRSGESEYIINGRPVRLLDVHLLLAKAQFAQGSYSVIGQGTIDRMLIQTPEDRKNFFDEASGIKEFQIKRHQAMLKLRRSQEYMRQADLLLTEIAPRLKTLSRQVKKLEQRQSVELELRELQENYYATLWITQSTLLSEVQEKLNNINLVSGKLNSELSVIQEELAGMARSKSRQDVFAELQKKYQIFVYKKNIAEKERAVLQGRLQTEYNKVGKNNVTWLENKIDAVGSQLKEVEIETETVNTRISVLEKESVADNEKLSELEVSRTQLRGTLNRLKQKDLETKSEQSLWQLTGKHAVQSILNNKEQFGEVSGAVAQLGSVKKTYQMALDVATGSHLSSIVVRDDVVAERCIGYLREHQLGFATFLPLNKIRARVIPRDIDEILTQKGVHGLAIDLVSFDLEYEDIFSYVLGATVVVEDISIARRIGIGRIRMVTLEGDILETSGSMKGGFRRNRNYGLSFSESILGDIDDSIMHEDLVEKTQKELESVEREYDITELSLRKTSAALEVAKEKYNLFESRKRELVSELSSLEQEKSFSSMSPKDYDSVTKDMSVKKDAVEIEIKNVEKEMEKAQKDIQNFNEEQDEKQKRVFEMQDLMQEKQNEVSATMVEKNDAQIRIAKLETKLEDLEQEAYFELHTSLPEVARRTQVRIDISALDNVQSNIQKLKYKLSLIGGIDEEVIEEHKETKERYDELGAQLSDLEKAIDDMEALVAELDDVCKKKREKAFKQIRKEFARYFKILFDGGKADLVEFYGEEDDIEEVDKINIIDGLVQEKNDLENIEDDVEYIDSEENAKSKANKKRKKKILKGIDIIANPPGKKISNIQMLSGGERTLTSIALICAILRTNPSPFVVLDEVEAALDEANTVKFTEILLELSAQSQFILITHNKATMHAADALYGVTMGNDGISELLSVKIEPITHK